MAVVIINNGLFQTLGLPYTNITDDENDWTNVGNDIYFFDKATKLVYYKNASGTVVKVFGESGGGGDSIYTADGTVSSARAVNLDNKKITFDAGTLASGTNSALGIEIDGSNIFYGGGGTSSALLLVKGDLGDVLNVNSGGFLVSKSDYTSAIAQFRNRANTKGFDVTTLTTQLACSTFRFNPDVGSTTTGIIMEVGSSLQQISLQQGGTISHWLRSGDSAAQASFFVNGFSGRGFNVGSGLPIGSEDISLQGHTIVKGGGTTTGTTLALYDNDSTPTKTWDFLDNGDVVVGQNVNFVANSASVSVLKFYRPSNGVGFGAGFDIDLKNSANEQTNYGRFGALIVSATNGSEYGKSYVAAMKNGTITVISYFDSVDGLCIENVTTANLFKAGDLLTVSKTDTTIKGGEAPLNLYRASSAATFGTALDFSLNNSSNVKTAYGDMFIQIVDNTASSEDGSFSFRVAVNGTKTVKIKINTNFIEFEDNLDMKNNRILNTVVNPTVQESLGGGTFTINADQQSDGVLTAMSANTTIAAPTGTPVQSQSLIFRFKDNGTARTIAWNGVFRAIGVTLPTTTVVSKLTYVGCKYNSTDTKWDVVSVQQEA